MHQMIWALGVILWEKKVGAISSHRKETVVGRNTKTPALQHMALLKLQILQAAVRSHFKRGCSEKKGDTGKSYRSDLRTKVSILEQHTISESVISN